MHLKDAEVLLLGILPQTVLPGDAEAPVVRVQPSHTLQVPPVQLRHQPRQDPWLLGSHGRACQEWAVHGRRRPESSTIRPSFHGATGRSLTYFLGVQTDLTSSHPLDKVPQFSEDSPPKPILDSPRLPSFCAHPSTPSIPPARDPSLFHCTSLPPHYPSQALPLPRWNLKQTILSCRRLLPAPTPV